ncbi:hypothetical protein [Vibrio europaeus]|uniref:prenylated flavin chaperone LpdD n=1 Tax=Vibrio europaeus TaxID=300876 RepID=UPI003AA8038F
MSGALDQPRASLKNTGKVSASTSVICVLGHKEELLAHHVANIDDASKQRICVIQSWVQELLNDFIDLIQVVSFALSCISSDG